MKVDSLTSEINPCCIPLTKDNGAAEVEPKKKILLMESKTKMIKIDVLLIWILLVGSKTPNWQPK